jgi:hypothetical protein
MAKNDRRIALRAPADTYGRAERVRAAIARRTLAEVTTAEVLRSALLHGLKVLERRNRR